MIYPLIAIQMPDGTLYERCSYCKGGGKMILYTSDSNYPGSKESARTNKPCLHCVGNGYDASSPVKVIPVKKFTKPKW